MRKKHSRNVLLLLLSVLMVCGCFYGCNSDKNTEAAPFAMPCIFLLTFFLEYGIIEVQIKALD